MKETNLSIRIDQDTKKHFEEFCNYEIESNEDDFYTNANMKWLKESIEQLESGKYAEHDLSDID